MIFRIGCPCSLVGVRREIAVLLTANGASCFFLAGCFAAGVVGQLFAADIAVVVFVYVGTFGENLAAGVTLVVFVCVGTLAEYFAAGIALVIFVCVGVSRFVFLASADGAFVPVIFRIGCPCSLIGVRREIAVFKGCRALFSA